MLTKENYKIVHVSYILMRNFESTKTIKTTKLTSVLLFGPLARQMPVGSQYHAIRAFLYQAMDEYQMHTDDSNFSCGNNDPFLISPLKIHQLRVPTIKKLLSYCHLLRKCTSNQMINRDMLNQVLITSY